ncbi:A/G-specific adenine glycosylase [Methylophaga frappieri]|uniref:A/G-specific adenine glycosylase n=1 Tax=Methylophaga frappieri (strain ATCC BAA-2434 / DSM 25690 / JAM7) TaxID=754477 RepID=I1YGB7_METFJ|nr:AsmA family protein [Methylophaga frappieri]AFJ01960.1 A/G-specific adenine glycosylase [Methylophaga frappieri]
MRTLIKVIVGLVILLIVAIAAIPFFVDPNDYKDEIASQVEKATGRQLVIQGDIELSVFPWLALQLGQMSLSNAEGFEADNFAQVNAADIRIKLLPLLKKEIEMDTIVLDGLVLNLETDKNGKTNWQDLSQSGEVTAETNAADEIPDDAPPALAAISIAGVQLTDANIMWSDASKGENYQLRNLNLETDPLVPGQPTALSMKFDIISAKPAAKAYVTLDSDIIVDMENEHYQLTDLNVTTLAEGSELPFDQLNLALNADISAEMARQVITIGDMNLETMVSKDDQQFTGALTGQVNADLNAQNYTVTDLLLDGTITAPDLPGGKAPVKLSADVTSNLASQTASLTDLAVQVQELVLNGQIKAEKILSDTPAFNGNMQVNNFNLRQLAEDLKVDLPEMADESTLENVALKTQLSGSSNHIALQEMTVVLDQSTLTGDFRLTNFAAPAYQFNLVLDKIDADRYLPPPSETEAEPAPPASAAAGAATELPLDTLRQINAKGSLKVGELKITGLTSKNILVTINAENGLIKLTPLQADLYEGQYQGNVTIDARNTRLKFAVDERLTGIQAGPLLKDISGDDKISGKADAAVKLTGTGANIDEIKKSLTGNGNFAFSDGALKGINIAGAIRQAKAVLQGQKLADDNTPQTTDFSKLSGSFTANEGIIQNDDLELMSPLLRVQGKGKANLSSEAIDYGLRVSIVGTAEGQGGKALADLKGVTIPVKITGTFASPKPSVDLAAVVKDQAEEKIKAKAEEKLKEKLGDEVGGLLGGALLGNKKAAPEADSEPENQANSAPETATSEAAPSDTPDQGSAPSAEEQLKEEVKDKLKKLF